MGVRLGPRTCLRPSTPTPVNGGFRRPAVVSLLRQRVATQHAMLPYRYFLQCYPASSVSALYPIIIHARTLDQ